ncbi:HAD family phosphatase [Candidatus Woesearchaeota archaeon]|nr:HAD family phosphatase [Candidatus Woesearchaeota archaeon]
MIKAIIFDLDGVLRDSEWVNVKAAEKSFSEIEIVIDENDKKTIAGRHPADYVPLLQKKYDIDYEEYLKIKRKNYFELLKDAKLFPGAKKVLEVLKKNNFKLGLATSSDREGTYAGFIKPEGLDNFFDAIVTFEDCSKRKPNPEVYLTIMKKLKVKPAECIIIEDTEIGVEAAKNAGAKCIAIPTELTKEDKFLKADIILNSLKEINLNLIKELSA